MKNMQTNKIQARKFNSHTNVHTRLLNRSFHIIHTSLTHFEDFSWKTADLSGSSLSNLSLIVWSRGGSNGISWIGKPTHHASLIGSTTWISSSRQTTQRRPWHKDGQDSRQTLVNALNHKLYNAQKPFVLEQGGSKLDLKVSLDPGNYSLIVHRSHALQIESINYIIDPDSLTCNIEDNNDVKGRLQQHQMDHRNNSSRRYLVLNGFFLCSPCLSISSSSVASNVHVKRPFDNNFGFNLHAPKD